MLTIKVIAVLGVSPRSPPALPADHKRCYRCWKLLNKVVAVNFSCKIINDFLVKNKMHVLGHNQLLLHSLQIKSALFFWNTQKNSLLLFCSLAEWKMLNSLGGKGWCIYAKMQYALKLSTVTAKELKTDLIDWKHPLYVLCIPKRRVVSVPWSIWPKTDPIVWNGGGAAGRVTYFAWNGHGKPIQTTHHAAKTRFKTRV